MTNFPARWAMLVVTVSLTGCFATAPPTPPEAIDGLQQIDSRRLEVVLLRPGVDFGSYTGVLLDEPELAFRTPSRAERQFPLAADQRTRFHALLVESFVEELSSSDLRLVDETGPDVLRLKVRVQDITATIPPRAISGGGGRASIALTAIGEATLVLELEDSETNEVLARAFDTRATEGIAISTADGPVTRWEDIERICERWASAVQRGLETLVSE